MQSYMELDKVFTQLEREVNQLKGMSVAKKSPHQRRKIYRNLLREEEEQKRKEEEKHSEK